MRTRTRHGFTLIELLVAVSILALLVSILLPALGRARTMARIVKAHAELRGIRVALEMYRDNNRRELPPTRFSCSRRSAYELPVELTPYLPGATKDGLEIVKMPDPFTPGAFYKYRAVGPAIMNEATIVDNAATLWIPDGFPNGKADTGRYHNNPELAPVRYAVYSMGPNPHSPKFDIPGRLPLPSAYWLKGASDEGVIMHCEDSKGFIHQSP